MKITNAVFGTVGTPPGERCIYFDIDGRRAGAAVEQKQGISNRGLVFIWFEDDGNSHLPTVTVRAEDGTVLTASDKLISSPWLVAQLRRAAGPDFVTGQALGDQPGD